MRKKEIKNGIDQNIDFSFITDNKIKDILLDYWEQAKSAYKAEVYAGVVVLCGGILEGLLAWVLSTKETEAKQKFPQDFKNNDGTEKPIRQWDLTHLINDTRKLDLIGETSARLLRAVQGFRNFIHPYNAIQGSARPDKRLANISLETVKEVGRSIHGRLPRTIQDT